MLKPNSVVVVSHDPSAAVLEIKGHADDMSAAREAIDNGKFGEGSFDLLTVRELGREIRSKSTFEVKTGELASRNRGSAASAGEASDL